MEAEMIVSYDALERAAVEKRKVLERSLFGV